MTNSHQVELCLRWWWFCNIVRKENKPSINSTVHGSVHAKYWALHSVYFYSNKSIVWLEMLSQALFRLLTESLQLENVPLFWPKEVLSLTEKRCVQIKFTVGRRNQLPLHCLLPGNSLHSDLIFPSFRAKLQYWYKLGSWKTRNDRTDCPGIPNSHNKEYGDI